jgi:hypothetical protein
VPVLIGGVIMPNGRFYVRNHFQIPRLNVTDYRLAVGACKAEASLSLDMCADYHRGWLFRSASLAK